MLTLTFGTDQVVVHAEPLRVNDDGLLVSPVWVAWKPMPTDALGASAAL